MFDTVMGLLIISMGCAAVLLIMPFIIFIVFTFYTIKYTFGIYRFVKKVIGL